MRSRHSHFNRLSREGRHIFEFLHQTQIYSFAYWPTANAGRVKNIRIMFADKFWEDPLKSRYLLPEVIQHRVRWRMSIVSTTMHLATGDDVNARNLLFQDCGLSSTKLRVSKIARQELAGGD